MQAKRWETNSWSEFPMMPPRHGFAGAVVNGRLHLASGDIQSDGITGMCVGPTHTISSNSVTDEPVLYLFDLALWAGEKNSGANALAATG